MTAAPYGDRIALPWEKARASSAVFKAVASGVLSKPDTCSRCGEPDRPKGHSLGTRIMGHHDDYAKPLEVRWLCFGCHGFVHSHEMVPLAMRA